ncbi:hypothetical protein QTJ16_000400 [Diplocarpon rosae]|uniref:Cutinase n=1 Tax=Diplocarpon rosae TaxID=946125 RepID=A0AAD9WFL5_9HELO|nr:hypothetical protein QTJ16_000400 [Diplocarpon rosae]
MRSSVLLILTLSTHAWGVPTLHPPRQALNATSTACATGVHMIVARASTEMPGQGIIGAVATQVQEMVPGSDSEAVDYPATLTDYLKSEASGVSAMTKLIQDYAVRCPESKMALMGYSQMGDPTHVPGQPQDVGNSTRAGIFPRMNTAACAGMAPITKSFCNDDDRFCDSGTSIPVHLAYVQGFGTQARDFVVARVTGNVAAKGNVTKRGW